jgi:hypothetical protein
VRTKSGPIRLTGTTDSGEPIDQQLSGEASLDVICNTPYAMGVERRLRQVELPASRDLRVRAPATGREPVLASAATDTESAAHALLTLGVAMHVSGNGSIHESHCLLAPPRAHTPTGAMLPAVAPCGVRAALDDTSRPLARADARLIVTGSLAPSATEATLASLFATDFHPESGTRVADLAPIPALPGVPEIRTDVLPVSPPAPRKATVTRIELDHLSFSIATKF